MGKGKMAGRGLRWLCGTENDWMCMGRWVS